MLQNLIVALVVAASLVYASWVLIPSSLRSAIARGLLRFGGWPASTRDWLTRRATAPSGCGCDGCDSGAKVPARGPAQVPGLDGVKPVQFHPRSRR